MIVTEKSFMESVRDLKKVSQAWAEIAAYEVGTGPLWVLFFIIFVGFIILIGSAVPFAFGIFLILVGFMLFIALATYVNTTYYTLL